MKRISILLVLLMAMLAPLAMNGQTTANVVSGATGTNQYIPMYNWYNDNGFRSEYIIPASYFTSAGLTNGDMLKSITLYRSATASWTSSTMTIQLTNTPTSYYSNTTFLGKNGTEVYSTTSFNGGTSSSYTFNFDSDFEYTGGSLVVHIYAASGGTCTSSSNTSTWLGIDNTTNDQALYAYGNGSATATTGTAQTFIPNTTFTYIHPSGNPITLTQPANGTISVSVNGGTASTHTTYAEAGQSVTLTATANSGYSFDSWNVSGATGTAAGSTYTFTMPDNPVTVTANIIPTSGGTGTTTVWTETSSITANKDYLIGLTNNNNVYLIVNYAVDETNHYYTSDDNQIYYGYTAQASFDGNGHVTGVSGYATDLQYCIWQFSSTTGGTIKSGYQNNYYLNTYTNTSYADLYPGTNNQTWSYSSGELYRTIQNRRRYAEYHALNNNDHMQVTSTEPSANVKLYTQTTTTTYAITATASPAAGGTVSGSEYYASGATCTLTATPNADYDFVNWTENGSVVSTEATYSFTVSSARTLVANFTLSSCPKPTNLTVSNVTYNSAEISWESIATDHEIEYAKLGLMYNFDDGSLQGWTNLKVNSNGGEWISSDNNGGGYDYTTEAHSGECFAMSYSYVDGGGGSYNTDVYLVSPQRYEITSSSASLNYFYAWANPDYPDYLEVCVSTAATPTASSFTSLGWSVGNQVSGKG